MFITTRIASAAVLAALVAFSGALPALAGDVALLLGNRQYAHAAWMYGAESALANARALEREGFVVIQGRNIRSDEIDQALDELERRIDDADRVVIQLNGHFVHTTTATWFLPVDARSPSLATIGRVALSLDTVLAVAAARPGGAVVALGTEDRRIPLGWGLSRGIGRLDIPQGVTVITGAPQAVSDFLAGPLLAQGLTLAEAAAQAPDGVELQGFVSARIGLAATDTGPRLDAEALTEEGYWQFALDLNSREGFAQYLERYPRGAHAGAARARLRDIEEAPRRAAEAAERALRLSRDERRRIQQHLTLLGHDTRGVDGIFGRGTRAAIAAWQKAAGVPETGYLDAEQIDVLRQQAREKARELEEEAAKRQAEEEARDTAYWERTGARGTERGLRRYLRRYPDGLYADIARERLAEIIAEREGSAEARERRAWRDAREADTIAAYEAYLNAYPDGLFAEDAAARIDALKAEAAQAEELAQARAEEEAMGLNVLARVLVEKRLNALGLKAGPEDGTFDDATRAAIRRYQKSRGLKVNGYLTRETAVRLLSGG